MMAWYCRVSTRRQKADSQKVDILHWLTSHTVPPAAVQWFEISRVGPRSNVPPLTACNRGSFSAPSRPWWSGNSTEFRGGSVTA